MVCVICCAQNIQNLQLSLIVEGMFQNAYNIALYNKCDVTVRAGGWFEEGIVQKLLVIQ